MVYDVDFQTLVLPHVDCIDEGCEMFLDSSNDLSTSSLESVALFGV